MHCTVTGANGDSKAQPCRTLRKKSSTPVWPERLFWEFHEILNSRIRSLQCGFDKTLKNVKSYRTESPMDYITNFQALTLHRKLHKTIYSLEKAIKFLWQVDSSFIKSGQWYSSNFKELVIRLSCQKDSLNTKMIFHLPPSQNTIRKYVQNTTDKTVIPTC